MILKLGIKKLWLKSLELDLYIFIEICYVLYYNIVYFSLISYIYKVVYKLLNIFILCYLFFIYPNSFR